MLRCGFLSLDVTSSLIDGVDGCSPTISNSVRTTKSRLGALAPLFVFVRRTDPQDIVAFFYLRIFITLNQRIRKRIQCFYLNVG